MSKVFDEIKEEPEQAITYEKGKSIEADVFIGPAKRRDRNYRREIELRKKQRLLKIVNSRKYNPARGYVEWGVVNGEWKPVGQYIKYPKNSKRQKYYKRLTNRIVRRNELGRKGNGYRKHFDYWWKLY